MSRLFASGAPGRLAAVLWLTLAGAAWADPPHVSYVFPAGGQRGAAVSVRIGGHNLHDAARLHLHASHVRGPEVIRPAARTIWFEGPVIPQPASQQREDYPRDYAADWTIAADAPLGLVRWRVSTSQGVTPSLLFQVGDLPEVVEQEVDGDPLPTHVALPVTINGRIFPREDVDLWTFAARAGETYTAEVWSARLGAPFNARLEVLDPQGRPLAESVDAVEGDPRVRFTAATDGAHTLRIHDVALGGLQHYVYRLTVVSGPVIDAVYPLGGRRGATTGLQLSGPELPAAPVSIALPDAGETFAYRHPIAGRVTNEVVLALDDLPEFLETEPNDAAPALPPLTSAAIVNGRIERPGDVDAWAFTARKDAEYLLDVRAARIGSALDSVLEVRDGAQQVLAEVDDAPNAQTDSTVRFKAPADGEYVVRVRDSLATRGGPAFGYRLRFTPVAEAVPTLRIEAERDALIVERGKETTLKLALTSFPGGVEPFTIQIDQLPPGVAVDGTKIAQNATTAQLKFKADASARIGVQPLRLTYAARINGVDVSGAVQAPRRRDEPPSHELPLAVALPTPFKFAGAFESRFLPRGTVFVRRYTIQRGGYTGSLEVRLADRQARHLQGVTGPVITVPAGATEFEYPIQLSPWLELGRTSRTCLSAVGVVTDADGSQHTVNYSSQEQNDQLIVITGPGLLDVTPLTNSVRGRPGTRVTLPVRVSAAPELTEAIRVELVAPEHVRGVRAAPATCGRGETAAELTLEFAEECGPFTQPLTVRATTRDRRGQPVVSQAAVEVAP